MRKLIAPFTVLAVALGLGAVAAAAGHAATRHTISCDKASLPLVSQGTLTIGTDNPAYPPWYAGGAAKGSKWKINDPSTGKGFESAVAYAVAKKLGFAKNEVTWVYVPFN
jgi:polar amino acid transport system substrate-binding protein